MLVTELWNRPRRHVAIASLLGVGAIILAVNKMDLVGWDEETFLTVAKEVRAIAESVPGEVPVIALPVSALEGDNVVERSD
ncbi:MAG: GTP-binding protein [Microthrixaceae bacterium]